MAQIARTGAAKAPANVNNIADNVAAAGKVAAEQTIGAARESAAWAEGKVQASASPTIAAVERQAAEGTAEARQIFLNLASEQTRHNLETMKALAGALDWGRVLQIQAEYVRVSLERSAQLTQRVLEVGRTMMVSAASSTQRQARKSV